MDPRLVAVLAFVKLLIEELPQMEELFKNVLSKWSVQQGVPLVQVSQDKHEAIDEQIDEIIELKYPHTD